jgi:hypothetical protein
MTSRAGKRPRISHEFHVWNVGNVSDTGHATILDCVLDVGKHGEVCTLPPVAIPSERVKNNLAMLDQCAVQNRFELFRAMTEHRKWLERVRHSPLGKVQQDYLAYYDDVVARFVQWFVDTGLAVPDQKS